MAVDLYDDPEKTMLSKYLKPHLLILDELGMKSLPVKAAEALLEVIHRRYQHQSTIIATNRPIEDWGKILGDNAATSAVLDRFLELVHIIKITGRSYRLRNIKKGEMNIDKKEVEKGLKTCYTELAGVGHFQVPADIDIQATKEANPCAVFI